ncbi:DUF3800 domain-containing protein [Dyadobacter sp. NIV53]|uniref:DUF3800 domain-containing protein n=1 Tax=Dyadobacter sp. NIV53 TaxID=2861765 RepID=UPI001C87FBB0|nr:DUF3800 domain-containing protein [Dyadobacter sp. NIV53]
MSMHNHVAFVDEWGNNGLDFTKKGRGGVPVSTHFIVVALTMPKDDIVQAEEVLERVRKKYFSKGIIKSSTVGTDHKRRKLILEELLKAPFQIFALVVDKRQLVSEGLRYKGSFYKFLHGLADRELFKIFPNLEMVASQRGTNTFMEGFIKYVHQTHIANLFNESSFGFVNNQDSLMVQAANFIAGTLARCYDETVITDQRQSFVDLLHPRLLTIKFWPDVFEPYLVKTTSDEQHYDATLAELSVKLANDFLHRKAPSQTPHVIDQHTCLSYLVFHFRHINANRYISSFEIIEHIKARRGKAVSLHYFQTKVIAPLRDAGVLIASSSRGYKLPASEADLYDFVNHSNTIIEPMLSRIQKFRNQIRMATNGELDVLDREEYSMIRKVVD